MPAAPRVPILPSDGAPISVLVDYDGTISRRDVGGELLARFLDASERSAEQRVDAAYDAGTMGSREVLGWDMDKLPADAARLRDAASEVPHDETFPAFVAAVRTAGAVVEVVSDGLGFYVESNLARHGASDLPVATNSNVVTGGAAGLSFPYGHPSCFVCGTCKRARVFAHQAADRIVLFVGDGTSDRFAAAHADLVFAKESLARICRSEGWAFREWDRFAEIEAWWSAALRSGELPRERAELPAWRAGHGLAPRPFICGPEVWGEGRTTPGPGPR